MILNINAKDLYTSLQKVAKVIPSKSTLPIITNVLINVSGNKLTLTGTDVQNLISVTMELPVEYDNFSICLEAKKLLELLKELGDIPIEISFNKDNNNIIIKTHYGTYTMVGSSSEDFPTFSSLSQENYSFAISESALYKSIKQTIFAVGNDASRPFVNNIYFDIKENLINFVATDIHRVMIYTRSDISTNFNSFFLLPEKSASLLASLLDDKEEENKVIVSFDNRIANFLINENFIFSCRLSESMFPNYNTVIPTTRKYKFIIETSELIDSIKRVSVLGNPATNLIKFELSPNRIKVSAEDFDLSTSAEEILPCTYEGENFLICFRAYMLEEILSHIESPYTAFEFNGPDKTFVIQPAETISDHENVLAVIMPVRTPES